MSVIGNAMVTAGITLPTNFDFESSSAFESSETR